MKRLCCVSRSLRWYVGVAAVVALAACDGGPKGPGVINASIVSPHNLGAVVVEVEGIGIEGFVGLGGTQAYGAEVSATTGRHRVVLVSAARLHPVRNPCTGSGFGPPDRLCGVRGRRRQLAEAADGDSGHRRELSPVACQLATISLAAPAPSSDFTRAVSSEAPRGAAAPPKIRQRKNLRGRP